MPCPVMVLLVVRILLFLDRRGLSCRRLRRIENRNALAVINVSACGHLALLQWLSFRANGFLCGSHIVFLHHDFNSLPSMRTGDTPITE